MLTLLMPRQRRMLIAIAAIYLYAFPYFPALRHANELPRIVTTEQIVERGTVRLDDRLSDLGSLADVSTTPDGRRYQNKAPGLSMLGAVPYAALSVAFHAAGRRPPLMLVTWVLRVVLATVPTLALLVCFTALSERFADSIDARGAALAAVALGSMTLPLGLLYMSHAIAASLIAIAFAIAVSMYRTQTRSETRSGLMAGALLGLAMLCEYQAVFAALIVGAYLLWGAQHRIRTALMSALAAAPFIGALAWYQWSAFGSPLRTGYAYSVDPANRVGVMGIVGFSNTSLAQLFIRPDNGLLLLSPWILLAAVGAAVIARDAGRRARAGRETLVAAAVVIVYCGFVGALEPEFGRGGWSIGPRYLAIAIPFFGWLAAAGADVCLRRRALRIAAFGAIAIGVMVHVLAASTYPHWPIEFQNPIFEVSVRSLREGHAPYSFGTLMGLRGFASVAPLYAGALLLTTMLLAPSRRHLADVSAAIVLAAVIVLSYEKLATTPPSIAEPMWRFVSSTFEPRE